MNHYDVRNLNVDMDYDEYAGRDGKWGNPYEFRGVCDLDTGEIRKFKRFSSEDLVELVPVKNRREAILSYSKYIVENIELFKGSLLELEGKTLGCHCDPVVCHASVVLYLRDLLLGKLERVDLDNLGNVAEVLRCQGEGFYVVVGDESELEIFRALGEHVCGDTLYPILIYQEGIWSEIRAGVYVLSNP